MHFRRLLLSSFMISIWTTLMLAQTINSSQLIGRWQIHSNAIASGWNGNYQFYSNGRFIYHFNQMVDEGKRIVSVRGNYRVFR